MHCDPPRPSLPLRITMFDPARSLGPVVGVVPRPARTACTGGTFNNQHRSVSYSLLDAMPSYSRTKRPEAVLRIRQREEFSVAGWHLELLPLGALLVSGCYRNTTVLDALVRALLVWELSALVACYALVLFGPRALSKRSQGTTPDSALLEPNLERHL